MSSIKENNKRIEQVGDYIIQNRIGQGSFATVYKAQHKDTQQTVAIKSVKRSKLTKKLLENLESEISILTAIRHKNIVGLIECQKTESNIFLVMEYCSLGDLSHFIKELRSKNFNKSSGLPERMVRHFLKQLANALKFLRSQNLIHRDIKPQNLLLSPSDDIDLPILKVADFGFARFLPNASLADTLCGSPLYMGPEILSYKKYDAKADLWSVGAVLYEMVTGRPPFRAQNHIELLKKIQENKDQIHFPDNVGHDLKDLIRHLLKRNPVERLSFDDFFQHPAVLSKPLKNYEPPPFAPIISSSTKNPSSPRNKKIVPIHSLSSKPTLKTKKREEEEEEILQEYVVLDLRSIETNQFADELKSTPQTTHAVNIPKPTSAPLIRERKSSGSVATSSSSAAGSALAKALCKASVRLFGTPSPPKENVPHLIIGSRLSIQNQPQGFFDYQTNITLTTMNQIERLACMAYAVATLGDQRYDTHTTIPIQLSETMALYVKALSLLEEGLYIAQEYWQEIEEDEIERKEELTIRLNDTVQWMRDRFNSCLDRAERIHKVVDHAIEESCIVEKLLYNRALEMSRAAAVHELVGENINECEQDYQMAIWMLEAILQIQPNHKEQVIIEEEDRGIIHKCKSIHIYIYTCRNRYTYINTYHILVIDSICHRIIVLRKKKRSEQRIQK
ncbi:kinase-like domain-containing protein [Cokeromyces recurvatus]|uniref:kinase-like domain-containing protein n=1 Tax=Cokeromyces recurvatus TaxID=90255 RepID=UPI00221ED717|nr:kinase-like domain-containing protein [Cokeromyces recurvatus]KAI7899255.1 kinase-like domain-containing protein [Cokeromyces recurvatus]